MHAMACLVRRLRHRDGNLKRVVVRFGHRRMMTLRASP